MQIASAFFSLGNANFLLKIFLISIFFYSYSKSFTEHCQVICIRTKNYVNLRRNVRRERWINAQPFHNPSQKKLLTIVRMKSRWQTIEIERKAQKGSIERFNTPQWFSIETNISLIIISNYYFYYAFRVFVYINSLKFCKWNMHKFA